MQFQGVYTAIVTPFTASEAIDWDGFEQLVEKQIAAGVAGIVPVGTTGESPTLTTEEHDQVVAQVTRWVNGRCQVIAGTGSNCTRSAIRTTRQAEKAGVDACLLVNPYYNKPTQEGLFLHFKALAESVEIPVILYNIKGRTAVNLETPTLLRLTEACPNIQGVKEASGDLVQIREVIQSVPAGFSVLSGDDNLTLEIMEAGGHGSISVASNLLPEAVVALVKAALAGDFESAHAQDEMLRPLYAAQMIETNPIPIKAALAMKGWITEQYRLPLCSLAAAHRESLQQTLREMGCL